MQAIELYVEDEMAMLAFGRKLANYLSPPKIIFLRGELGAGKTTLVRGLLRGFNHQGSIKSPTYTLVEPYQLDGFSVYHFDLYRLADPEELEFIGIREYSDDNAILLFEWPDKGIGMIPEADLILNLDYQTKGRLIRLETNDLQLLENLV